jgi:LysM repeat protein
VALRRHRLARFAAPAAFLLAVTFAVLIVRSGLRGEEDAGETLTTNVQVTTVRPPTTTRATRRPPARFYVVQDGDTLGDVAERFDTTVERLLALNPGVEPTNLRVGRRLRVA